MKSSSFQVGFKLALASSAFSSMLLLLLLSGGATPSAASKTTAKASTSTATATTTTIRPTLESVESFESTKTTGGASRPAKSTLAATTMPPNRRQPEEFQALESNIANAKVQVSPQDMQVAAGHHHGKSHGKYYMYAEVPKKGAYKMGFKRGNHKHMIMRKESLHGSHFHSYFKWHDKKGKGSHKWEYKHADKKKHGHHYG